MNNYRARPLIFGLPCAVLCGMAWGQGAASVSSGQAQATPPQMQVQANVLLPPDTRRQDLRGMVSQHNGATAMAASLSPNGLDLNAKHLSLDERTQLRRQLTPEQRPGNIKP